MSVRKELEQHAEKQNKVYQQFLKLDQRREDLINETVELCKQGKPFSTDRINEVTNKINQINLGFTPVRKNVTTEMVKQYVDSL
ncbi:DUF2533 family protein [Mesobacillus harenae]|uniref:DUF2533 family protein n=1 Tax=Mesobacillus harenae TaxID=2213203 RepID=UPI0015805F7B|nr:DUF2533 family protein [Mesobacillus harenae]